jgi:DNA-binding CsgD family transcriptional regulator
VTTILDLDATRSRLELAMELVRQDRWQLSGLRDGRLKPIADSLPQLGRRTVRSRELSPLARRCLYERKPLTVSTILEVQPDPGVEDWEMDWPAILYAPVGVPGARPVGLLIVGSRRPHWYDQEEIDYVSSIAVTLTACVLTFTGPLGRLRPPERQIAQLLGEGMSTDEIAAAMKLDREAAREQVAGVLQKLSLRSRRQIGELMPDRPLSANGFLL